ncbi:MAG TPA: hypothetical protein P5121_10435 [Caldilineaceae bacterium]|nr:hypothetical protein [Caldilineaceae bacterium]
MEMELVKAEVDYLSQDAVRELAEYTADPCISLYMPTHRLGSEIEQDPIRLKNLLNQVEKELVAADVQRSDARTLLEPLHALIADREFWQHQSDGLVIFRSADWFTTYRLPIPFEELTVVGSRPHIKPLLPLIINNGHFYLLTLSQNQVRFFEGTRQQLGAISLGEAPTSLAEAMRYDEFNDQLQFHTQTGTNSDGGRAAIFHGHSDAGDEAVIKENIKRFLNQVDDAVCDTIDDNGAPLVLAGVEMMCGLYKEISQYPSIVPETIGGNVEQREDADLHAEAWALVEKQFSTSQQEAADAYLHLAGTDDPRAGTDLKEIVAGAYFQRIDTLFVQKDLQQWGTFDKQANTVHIHQNQQAGDTDLLDFAAVHTMLNGGTVYAVTPQEVPDGQSVAAIYRYGKS